MTSQAIDIANSIEKMSETEVNFLWDFLRKRHHQFLLNSIDMKLEESKNARTLTDDEVDEHLKKLGIA
ncbi:MAG: hypothetical protein LBQ95_00020 [Lachnospiraceae bacterium]|nr:hypothetical protein [Lachnospiraceae bacterium]